MGLGAGVGMEGRSDGEAPAGGRRDHHQGEHGKGRHEAHGGRRGGPRAQQDPHGQRQQAGDGTAAARAAIVGSDAVDATRLHENATMLHVKRIRELIKRDRGLRRGATTPAAEEAEAEAEAEERDGAVDEEGAAEEARAEEAAKSDHEAGQRAREEHGALDHGPAIGVPPQQTEPPQQEPPQPRPHEEPWDALIARVLIGMVLLLVVLATAAGTAAVCLRTQSKSRTL